MKFPIASNIPCGRVATPAGVSVFEPPEPQLTFSWPLSSFVTMRVQACWFAQVPEQAYGVIVAIRYGVTLLYTVPGFSDAAPAAVPHSIRRTRKENAVSRHGSAIGFIGRETTPGMFR